MNQYNTIGFHPGNSRIHQLNATVKLLFLLVVSISAMVTYDTRYLILISVSSILLFKYAHIEWKQVRFVVKFILFFTILNIIAVYIFDPEYGVKIYNQRTELINGIGRFTLTSQELFYLFNLILKYISTVPLALIFLFTTNPSHFAASLNQLGVNYKISYAVSLALRYIPDIQETYFNISQAQQARGYDNSKKAKFTSCVKGIKRSVLPLIFSSIERIDTISTAMELRQFGQYKRRTWYVKKQLKKDDYVVLCLTLILLMLVVTLFFLNNSRYFNPWY
ncbi:energy-coupling factor transporter transmembrane protein EcfT [Staphylococcus aureus]|uniref:energy-coupling factor transporter transmembrane component T family protein n=1 Tax=Staphylococcus aureus TaxID=1280 RepID=UPI0012B027FB|nr:energy-coupling factor transporter transmembrane component T [Staphylococcus aureus]MRV99122.1 energy-coupling factor transporter transmembrane protein EcfT [Staphylococcus aureus]